MRRRPGGLRTVSPSGASPDAWDNRCRRVAPDGPAGSSRSTSPRSTAVSTVRAVTSLVTEAQGYGWSTDPVAARVSRASVTMTAAFGAGHSLTASRAFTSHILSAAFVSIVDVVSSILSYLSESMYRGRVGEVVD